MNSKRRSTKSLEMLAITVVVWCAVFAICAAKLDDSDSKPCTVTVAVGESIQAAVDSVADGGVVCLESGVYEESFVIRKSLTLRGSGPDPASTRISSPSVEFLEDAGRLALVRVGEWEDSGRIEVHIENLSIGGEIAWASYALETVGQATLLMSDCEIGPSTGVGLQLSGSSRATIERTVIHDNMGYAGFNAQETSVGTIRNCEIVRNDGANVESCGSSQVMVCSTQILDCPGNHGIWIADRGSVAAEDCVITGNHLEGVSVNGQGEVSISNCDISENGHCGVWVRDSGQATVIDSALTNNGESGVTVWDLATVVLERNEINRNAEWGVFYEERTSAARFRITGCGNSIEDERGVWKNRAGDVFPDSLGNLQYPCRN